jgi:LPXTG-motif cell wall-anchored protein
MPCILPSTGFDSGWLLLVALAVVVVGVAAAVFGRRRLGKGGALVAVLVLGSLLVAGGQFSPQSASAAEVCPPEAGQAQPGVAFTPGAAGIGDAYFPLDGNGGYDVQHYDLDLAYDPASDELSGTATIDLVATQNLSSFNLDFDTRRADGSDALVIGDVRVGGASAAWSLASTQISKKTGQPAVEGAPPLVKDEQAEPPRTELTVSAGAGIGAGATVEVQVDYAGVPITIQDAFGLAGAVHTDDGMVIVGEPRVAAVWFPSNDQPSDKATMTMSMTVPDGLDVIGNGVLVDETTEGSTSTFVYDMDKPMATYLATAVVGDYDVNTYEQDGITYRDAVAESLDPSEAVTAADLLARNPEILDYLSQVFGPYPFTESGGIAIDIEGLGYALENQTRPIYDTTGINGPNGLDELTIVHELAHQWYGDDVSIASWSDIWLNEGFAGYTEWLWEEHMGTGSSQQHFDELYSTPADDPFWSGAVADPGAANIFNGLVYERGAMALHALRAEVGDDVFTQILRGWASENAGGNVTTAQFEAYASSVSGQDLTELFDTWLHTGGKPAEGASLGCGAGPIARC